MRGKEVEKNGDGICSLFFISNGHYSPAFSLEKEKNLKGHKHPKLNQRYNCDWIVHEILPITCWEFGRNKTCLWDTNNTIHLQSICLCIWLLSWCFHLELLIITIKISSPKSSFTHMPLPNNSKTYCNSTIFKQQSYSKK